MARLASVKDGTEQSAELLCLAVMSVRTAIVHLWMNRPDVPLPASFISHIIIKGTNGER
jgi:hypothetical protein